MSPLARLAAHAGHLALYVLMLAVPLALVVTACLALLFKAAYPLMPGWPTGFFESLMLGVIGLVLGGAAWQTWRQSTPSRPPSHHTGPYREL